MENRTAKTLEQKLDELSKVKSPVQIGEQIYYGSELSLFYNEPSMGTIDELVKDGDLSKEQAERNDFSSKIWGIHHYQSNSISAWSTYGYSLNEILEGYYNQFFEKSENKISEIEQKFNQILELFKKNTIEIDCNPGMFTNYKPGNEIISKISEKEFVSGEEKQKALKNGIFWSFVISRNSETSLIDSKTQDSTVFHIYGSSFDSVVNFVHYQYFLRV